MIPKGGIGEVEREEEDEKEEVRDRCSCCWCFLGFSTGFCMAQDTRDFVDLRQKLIFALSSIKPLV